VDLAAGYVKPWIKQSGSQANEELFSVVHGQTGKPFLA
jgi:hypothetical protein